MAFLVSPGVEVKEKDLTNIIPAVATSIGGFAGLFEWGPALEATLVSSEQDLIDKFGYPRASTNAGSNNRDDWFAVANFLEYSNNVQVVRVLPDGARNAVSEPVAVLASSITIDVNGTANLTGTINVEYDVGSSVAVSVAVNDTAATVAQTLATALVAAGVSSAVASGAFVTYEKGTFTTPDTSSSGGVTFAYLELEATASEENSTSSSASIKNLSDFLIEQSGLTDGSVYARYPGKLGNSIGIALIDAGCTDETTLIVGTSKLSDIFDSVPATSVWAQNLGATALADEVHVVVYTTDTKLTGTANEILETYSYLSKAKNSKTADGANNYYVDVINNASNYVYLKNEETAATGTVTTGGTSIGATITESSTPAFNAFISSTAGVVKYDLDGGLDGSEVTDGDYTEAFDIFNDVETVDVNLLFVGRGNNSKVVQKFVIEIAEARKDAIAFVSPDYASAVTNPTAAKIVEYFNSSTDGFNSTSYAVFDSGWKRQYDRYNDEYFWAPLNPDIAGLSARTDYTNEAWFSPAGLNRGFIKNVVKLSYNPNQADRDTLYPKRINPVVTFRGQGTLLYGDKTALSRPSAFDRINVRRLFIVLEKAIATAAKYQLFEFNDDLTRRVFVNMVEPFLADIKSRRGITEFKVVCDTSNNTGEVIDGNRFVADIYIKPARSINFMTLNFVAVRSGVSFSEVAGA